LIDYCFKVKQHTPLFVQSIQELNFSQDGMGWDGIIGNCFIPYFVTQRLNGAVACQLINRNRLAVWLKEYFSIR